MNQKINTTDIYRVILIIIFLFLFFALFNLQIVKGSQYKEIADRNYVRVIRINAARGVIYDEKLKPIVTNTPSINLYFRPFLIKDKNAMADFVSKNLPIPKQQILNLIHENRFRSFNEVLIYENIEYDTMAKITENLNFYPELFFKVETMRSYVANNHFTGYVGRINEKEYQKLKKEEYNINSMIGKSGIEKYYERILAGKPGYEVIQVDAYGRNLNFFKNNLNKEPENGLHLVLNINLDLQNYISEIYPKEYAGAVVVINPQTGGVLSYHSFPEFDQNWFTYKITNEQWSSLRDDPKKPMLDRVINGTYPPGSTFKPITGSLGLEKEVIDDQTLLAPCIGGLQIGNRFFKCWIHGGHGRTNIYTALKVSCDVFFYDLSRRLHLDDMKKFVDQNHLIRRTGIDIPFERKGFFPDNEWYKKRLGKYYSLVGRKANLAIGQGEVLVTPLQLCSYYGAIANNGVWMKPHLLKKAIGHKSIRYEELDNTPPEHLPVSPRNLKIIQDGLWQVVNAPGGTGGGARIPGVNVFGKTGSAENPHGGATHAWFAGYAVWDKPELVVVVFMENAGHGGSMSAPIAGKIINYYNTKIRK